MIPLRDTQDVRGPVWATATLVGANLVLHVAGQIPHMNFLQAMVALLGLWLFGLYVERRLGSLTYLAIYLILAGSTGFLVGSVDDPGSIFAISLFLPVLGLGLLHLALAPKSKILVMVPVPFAMSFYEVPTVAVLVTWVAVEVLLTAV